MRRVYQNGTWHYVGYSLDDLPMLRDQTRSSAPPLSMMQLREALKRLPSTTMESKTKSGRRTTKSSPGHLSPPVQGKSTERTKSVMKRNRSASDGLSVAQTLTALPETSATSNFSAPSAAPRLSLSASRSLANISHPLLTPPQESYLSYSRSYSTHPSLSIQVEASDNESTPEITFFDDNIQLFPSKVPNPGPLMTPGQSLSLPTSPTIVAPLVPPLNPAPFQAAPLTPLYSYNQAPQQFAPDCLPPTPVFPDFTEEITALAPIGDALSFGGEEYYHHYDPVDADL